MAHFIKWDVKVRSKSNYKVEIINRSSIPDFGNVRYILSDKTGTLTSRKFIMKATSIKGKIFSFDPFDKRDENFIFRMKNTDVSDLEIYHELRSNSAFSTNVKDLFECLSICHTVKKIRGKNEQEREKDVINNGNYSFIFRKVSRINLC